MHNWDGNGNENGNGIPPPIRLIAIPIQNQSSAPAHSRMGRQWSAGKLVLILDAVHWNPEAPPRTLPRVRTHTLMYFPVPYQPHNFI
ncbi:unnamed protein product [Prunus armeniaca]